MQMARNRIVRVIYLSLGVFFLGMGIAGTVMPLIPTTGPILLAAFFFSRSSERFDRWLVNHRIFGGIVRDWRAGRGFSARTKAVAVTAIAVTFTITILFAMESAAIRVLLVVLAASLVVYILRLPTKVEELVE